MGGEGCENIKISTWKPMHLQGNYWKDWAEIWTKHKKQDILYS